MGKSHKQLKKSIYILTTFLFLLILIFIYSPLYSRIANLNLNIPKTESTIKNANNDSNQIHITKQENNQQDIFGIKMLYLTSPNGRVWFSNWSNNVTRTLRSIQSDPRDSEFFARGNGTVSINGNGIATLAGDSPRMYVLDRTKNKKWNNVEVTIYAKRISESGITSSQGIVLGARSEHQDASKNNPCLGATYYGRLLYDGRAVFQKEVIHEGAYSLNMPKESNMAFWSTPDGTMPINVWIGVKFIVKTNPEEKSVKLELYRDLTDGKNGGTWEKVAEYTDRGNWSQTDSGADIMKICGYGADKILLEPGTSVFVRNDKVKDVEYKLWSIREIE